MAETIATKRVSSGKYIDLASLHIFDINIDDISRSLNYIYRFTGHWKDNPPLTVAQHTWLVCKLSNVIFPNDTEVELDCVVHDFAESYTGDIATPLKRLFGAQFKEYEDKVESLIYTKYYKPIVGHDLSQEVYEKRKICDLLAMDIERRALWLDHRGKSKWPDIQLETIFSIKEKRSLYDAASAKGIIDIKKMYFDTIERRKNNNEF